MNNKYTDWEYLQESKEFKEVDNNNLNIPLQYISIQRDEQYNIIMKIIVNDITEKDKNKLRKLTTLIFKHEYKLYRINCTYKKTERYFDYYSGKPIFIYTISKLEHKKSTYNQQKQIEWYLNGIKYKSNKEIYCQRTLYSNNKKQRLKNDIIIPEINNTKIVRNQVTISCPQTNFKKITIESISDEYNPSWSNSIAIEYHSIPTDEEKEKIHSILNFIFGRYLINIGTTILDINNNIINQVALSPEEGFDVKYICDMPEKSIILNLIVKPNKPDMIIKKLTHIINTYLNLNIDLSHTLHLYNQSLISNPNIEIIVLDASIDAFARTLGYTGSAKRRIYSFIYDRGLGQKDHNMISLGQLEDNLRNIRNQITHGEIINDKQLLYSSNLAYRILYGRILCTFLKLGKYYDLTTGKIRPINEPINPKEYENIQNILKREKYDNSRRYYIELFKQIRKKKKVIKKS